MIKIIKRDGKKVDYEQRKIKNAIQKAFDEYEKEENKKVSESQIDSIADTVELKIKEISTEIVDIETIQDIVQKSINDFGYFEVAKLYIGYRAVRNAKRKEREEAYKTVSQIMKATDRENANVGNGPSGKLLQTAEALGKDYAMNFLTPKGFKDVIESKALYRHDESWGITGTTTCTFIPLGKTLKGFNTGHGYTRQAKRFRTACQHACIIFQSNQNDQHKLNCAII